VHPTSAARWSWPGVPGVGGSGPLSSWNSFIIGKRAELPGHITRVSIGDGRREMWKELMPVDATGVTMLAPVVVAPGERYAYTYARGLTDLSTW
jgi:hypothetical protein